MRCTRCDAIAVPQALGRLPDGRLAFGLCVACLEAEGCAVIDVGPSRQHRAHRLRVRRAPRPIDPRRRGLRGLAGLLAAWGLLLAVLGATSSGSQPGAPPSPFGNGTPLLLTVGAVAMVLTALALDLAGRRLRRPAQTGRKNQSSQA
jgi:hypothetical protein